MGKTTLDAFLRLSRHWLFSFVSYAALLGGYLYLFKNHTTAVIEWDTEGYLNFARDILNGVLFQERAATEIPSYSLIRTPGYPMLIAFFEALLKRGLASVLVLHALIGAVTLIAVPYLLRKVCPVALSGFLLLLAFQSMDRYFSLVLPEWISLNFIFMLCGLGFSYFDAPKRSVLFMFGLLSAFLILTRPALIVLVPIPFLLILIQVRKYWAQNIAIAIAAFFPVMLWMTFNLWRVGSFTLTTFDGYSLFGVGSLVGFAETEAADPPDLASFILEVNEKKSPKKGEERGFVERDKQPYDSDMYNKNIYRIGLGTEVGQKVGTPRLNEIMKIYALRALKNHFRNYALYFWREVIEFWKNGKWIMIISITGILSCLLEKKLLPLALTVGMMLVVHLAHSFLCSATNMIIIRLHNLTFVPLSAMTALLMVAYLYSSLKGMTRA